MFVNIILLFSILSTINYVYAGHDSDEIGEEVDGSSHFASTNSNNPVQGVIKIASYVENFKLTDIDNVENMYSKSMWKFIDGINEDSKNLDYLMNYGYKEYATNIINGCISRHSGKGQPFENYSETIFDKNIVMPILNKCYYIINKHTSRNKINPESLRNSLLGKYGGLVNLIEKSEIKEHQYFINGFNYSLLITVMIDAFSDILDAINCVIYHMSHNITRDARLDILLSIRNIYFKVINLAEILAKLMDKYGIDNVLMNYYDDRKRVSNAYTEFKKYFQAKWMTFFQIYDESKSKALLDNFKNRVRHISGRLIQLDNKSKTNNDVYDIKVSFDKYYSIQNWNGFNVEDLHDWFILNEHKCLINLNVWIVHLIHYGNDMMKGTPHYVAQSKRNSETMNSIFETLEDDKKFMNDRIINEESIHDEIVSNISY